MSYNPVYAKFNDLLLKNNLNEAKKELEQYSININFRGTFHDKISVYFGQKSNIEIKKYLLEEKNGNVLALLDTLELNKFINGLEELISQQLNVDILYTNSFINACGQGAQDIAKYTYDKRKNINLSNDLALSLACKNNQLKMVEYLLEKGIKLKQHHLIEAANIPSYIDLIEYPKEEESYQVLVFLLKNYQFEKLSVGKEIIQTIFKYQNVPMLKNELYNKMYDIIYLLAIKHNMPYDEELCFILRHEPQLKNIIEIKKLSHFT